MVAWKAVSKQATSGTPGNPDRTASMPARDLGWCSGARSARSRSRRSTLSSSRTGRMNSRPPWTTRCPTASGAGRSVSAAVTVSASNRPATASTSRRATTLSPWSSRLSLRLLDPALTVRISIGMPGEPASVRPHPLAHLRRVLAVFAGVRAVPQPCVHHPLTDVRDPPAELRHPVDDVHDEVVAVEVVEHDHVERRRGRALLPVAAHVQVGVAVAAVGEPVDEVRVAVKGEDHGPVCGEDRIVLAVGEPVRMLAV